jgi:hypothetical protein
LYYYDKLIQQYIRLSASMEVFDKKYCNAKTKNQEELAEKTRNILFKIKEQMDDLEKGLSSHPALFADSGLYLAKISGSDIEDIDKFEDLTPEGFMSWLESGGGMRQAIIKVLEAEGFPISDMGSSKDEWYIGLTGEIYTTDEFLEFILERFNKALDYGLIRVSREYVGIDYPLLGFEGICQKICKYLKWDFPLKEPFDVSKIHDMNGFELAFLFIDSFEEVKDVIENPEKYKEEFEDDEDEDEEDFSDFDSAGDFDD